MKTIYVSHSARNLDGEIGKWFVVEPQDVTTEEEGNRQIQEIKGLIEIDRYVFRLEIGNDGRIFAQRVYRIRFAL